MIEEQVERIRAQVGSERVICGLSGGVDSAVAALLVYKAVGDQLTCVFVDHGLMRENEAEQVVETFGGHFHVPLVHVRAEERFLTRLAGVSDPETKRKIVGEEFIRVFEEEARKLGDVRFLVQGTLYSDVIESGGDDGVAAKIKSHHNVGGLPADMKMDLVEPLRLLFKDEVRRVGEELGMPERLVWRQPFPGPGLSIRIIGDVTKERLDILRAADAVLQEEIRRAGLYRDLWQSFAVLPGDQVRRRAGRRAHLRLPGRDPRRHLRGRDDGRLGPHPLRRPRDDLEPDHQRGSRRQPRRPRPLLEAAGHDRVGVSELSEPFATCSSAAAWCGATCPDPIDPEVIDRIVGVVRRAPSAGFSQGHRLVVVTEPETRRELARLAGEEEYVAMGLPPWISIAPVHVVVGVREASYHERYTKPDKLQDGGVEITWPAPVLVRRLGLAVHAPATRRARRGARHRHLRRRRRGRARAEGAARHAGRRPLRLRDHDREAAAGRRRQPARLAADAGAAAARGDRPPGALVEATAAVTATLR